MKITSSNETYLVEETNSYVEVSRRYPLWDALPAEYRATEEDVRNSWRSEYWGDIFRARLNRPKGTGCQVASKVPELGARLHLPCPAAVAPGAHLCRNHGGPPVRAGRKHETKDMLREERDRLAAELAALKGRTA